jgi:hypothetical protein
MIDLSTMKMICLRKAADTDAETLALCDKQEALLRDEDGFLLYSCRKASTGASEEQLMRIAAREALVWLNEKPDGRASISNDRAESIGSYGNRSDLVL